MTKFKAWPFLVSANRTTDYKVIVAPDFMIVGNQSNLLKDLATDQTTENAIYKEYTSNLVDISLFYRVVYAKDKGNILRDEAGRPIRWIEGFVFRENTKNYDKTEQVLDVAHSNIEKAFQDFWINDAKFATQSKAIDIDLNQKENLVGIQNREEPIKIQTGWSSTKIKTSSTRLETILKIASACFLISILFIGIWVFMFPRLEIVSPKGGENLRIGDVYDITWKTTGIDKASIDISYSVDGGKNWSPVAKGAPNNGSFEWTVPNIRSNECYIMIRTFVWNQSNKFTIS